MGGSATGTLGANNEATWCDIFPNVPPPVALAACGDRTSRGRGGTLPCFVKKLNASGVQTEGCGHLPANRKGCCWRCATKSHQRWRGERPANAVGEGCHRRIMSYHRVMLCR